MLLKDNYTEVLEGLLGEGDFFLNLSVDTGSCDLMSYVQRTCVPACLCACLSVCVWRCLPAYLSRCLAQALVARCRAYGCGYDCALALPNSTIDMGGACAFESAARLPPAVLTYTYALPSNVPMPVCACPFRVFSDQVLQLQRLHVLGHCGRALAWRLL